MKIFTRICTAILYAATALAFAGAADRTASAQSITFTPLEKPIILPASVQPFESIAVRQRREHLLSSVALKLSSIPPQSFGDKPEPTTKPE
jgi:hypothetical protein